MQQNAKILNVMVILRRFFMEIKYNRVFTCTRSYFQILAEGERMISKLSCETGTNGRI